MRNRKYWWEDLGENEDDAKELSCVSLNLAIYEVCRARYYRDAIDDHDADFVITITDDVMTKTFQCAFAPRPDWLLEEIED